MGARGKKKKKRSKVIFHGTQCRSYFFPMFFERWVCAYVRQYTYVLKREIKRTQTHTLCK